MKKEQTEQNTGAIELSEDDLEKAAGGKKVIPGETISREEYEKLISTPLPHERIKQYVP